MRRFYEALHFVSFNADQIFAANPVRVMKKHLSGTVNTVVAATAYAFAESAITASRQ